MTELRIVVEPTKDADPTGLAARVTEAVRDRFHFRPLVTLVASGTLPRFEMKANRLVRNQRSSTN
jgi:phenylacetate-coenzyme A ligase PaaK-like adenylate-forming protein